MNLNVSGVSSAKDATRKFGDFTGLASNYSKFRPRYAESILDIVLKMAAKPVTSIEAADLGAGTGLWTRMIAKRGVKKVSAVEPNDDMRSHGQNDSADFAIEWKKGSGEITGLDSGSYDLVTAASCFHWFDFEKGTAEINRLLRPGAHFMALWNPRFIEANPLFVEIENYMKELTPNIKRVSSGTSEFTAQLFNKLSTSPYFSEVVYLEGRHSQFMTPDQYIGAWLSVNDIQVQMGAEAFAKFMAFVERKVRPLEKLEAVYQTRAWVAKKR